MHTKILTLLLGCFSLSVLLPWSVKAQSDGPVISRVHGGLTKTLWGLNFDADTEFMATNLSATSEELENAISVADYDGINLLPVAPSEDAKALKVVDRDQAGRVAAVITSASLQGFGNADAAVGPEVLWAKNSKGVSSPVLLRSAQPWWVYPYKAAAGNRVRLFGRNFVISGPKEFLGLIAIKPKGKSEAKILTPLRTGRNRMYELEFVLPPDLASGEHEIYYHNGTGGVGGWGGPVTIAIHAKPVPNTNTYPVAAPVTGSNEDSTKAIVSALEAAKTKGGTVVLEPGIYEISKTLRIPEGVSLRGAGAGATTLRPVAGGMAEGFPTGEKFEGYSRDWMPHMVDLGYAPLIWVRSDSTISDLKLEQDETSGIGILVARAPGIAENITIARVVARSYASTLGWVPSAAVRGAGDTNLLSIIECDFEGRGGIEINSAVNRGLYIARNKLRCVPEGKNNVVFLRGTRDSVFEDNFISGGLRAIVFQDAKRFGKDQVPEGMKNSASSIVHTFLGGNQLENTVARRHNDGETMFESNDEFWAGNPTEVTANGFRVADAPFNAMLEGNFAFVCDGDGLGEMREIVSHTNDTVTLDRPWTVRPTPKSVIKVSAFATKCLWVDNTESHIAGPFMFWGSCVDNVADGHIQREGGGFVFWAPKSDTPMTVAFNDLINSRFIGRGNIRLLGPLVFGNTIRFNEVIDFHYRPSYHSVQGWISERDQPWSETPTSKPGWPSSDVGILVIPLPFNSKLEMPYLSENAPISAWNVIEGNHLRGEGTGIRIPEMSRHFILRGNAIKVSGTPLEAAPGSIAE